MIDVYIILMCAILIIYTCSHYIAFLFILLDITPTLIYLGVYFRVDIDTRHQELGHGTCYKAISTTHSVSVNINNRQEPVHSH